MSTDPIAELENALEKTESIVNNELRATAILDALDSSGWRLRARDKTSVSERLDEIEARYKAETKASNARIAALIAERDGRP